MCGLVWAAYIFLGGNLTQAVGVAAIPGTGKLITRFTPNKFQSVSRQVYKEVLDKAVDLIASAKRGTDIMRSEQFLKFRDLITAQMLRIKIAAECRAFNTNSFYSSFENLYLKTGRLNNGAYIADYRFLDDAQVLDFSKGRATLVEDRALADKILNSSNYEKVGAIDNTSYLKKDRTNTIADLDIYQNKVSPDKFVVIERVNVGVQGAGSDLLSFVNKTLTQKLDDIKGIWSTKYPIQEMLEGRSFFEDIMGQYRYLKSSGWSHTGDISEFFKGVDFYKGSVVGDQIFANTAVSMKTTITTNVDNWLASAPMQKNIEFLQQALNPAIGLSSNNKIMRITNAEIHIYMPKANITESLKTTWMNKLNTVDPKIKFEIKALEDFIQ